MDVSLFGFAISASFIWQVIRVALTLALGIPLIIVITRLVEKALAAYGTAHMRLLIGKVVYYLGVVLLLITLLNELGFNLTALLGAAGIFGVAIGFAAQTSMSNLISGLFLLSENFLSIGDTISAGSVYGEIESIDLFSVKVRTNDGMLVRIPNEQLIKNDLVNVTFYPSRRIEIAIGVPANESLDRLISMVNNVIAQNKFVISNPSPVIVINSLSSNAQHITLRVWSEHKNILTMKTTLVEQLNDHLISEGIKTLFVSAR